MNTNKLPFIFACAVLAPMVLVNVSGCATKSYPTAVPLSSAEAERMTCGDLELEIVRAEQIENKINETGSFDGKTALGFLGDLALGTV